MDLIIVGSHFDPRVSPNGYALEPTEEDEVITMVAVADSSLREQQFADWLRRSCTRPMT